MGAYNRNRRSALKQALVVQIKKSIALTDLLIIKLQNFMINRFHHNIDGGTGGGGDAYNQMYLKVSLFSRRIWTYNCGGVILSGEFHVSGRF